MKRKHKALLLTMCLVLLAVGAVFGTLAYFTDQKSVTNTFTVGSIGLKLDEAKVNEDGKYVTDETNRVQENQYHLLPGRTYIKDPTATVTAKSEDAYVRMLVEVERIDQLEEALPDTKYYKDGVFLLQLLCVDEAGMCTWNPDIWKMNGYKADGTTGIYEFRYVGNDVENPGNGIVVKSEDATVLPPLFTSITVPGEIDNEHIKKLHEVVKINVKAHAIQAIGFTDEDAAWDAFGVQHPQQ